MTPLSPSSFPLSFWLVLASSLCACGDPGTTPDTENGTHYELHAVTHGAGRFVAVGYEQDVRDGNLELLSFRPMLMSSADGASWTRHDGALPQSPLQDVAFGNGVFVAVGGNLWPGTEPRPIALSSADGMTWTDIDIPTTEPLRHVTFGGGLFVMVANDGQTFVSTDGTTFTPAGVPTEGYRINGITFGAGRFVAWGWNQGVFVSPDSQTYTSAPIAVDEMRCMHFFGGQFQGVGIVSSGADEQPTITSFLVSSMTGDTWSQGLGSFPCTGLAESNGVVVSGSGDQLFRSSDGKTFTAVYSVPKRGERLDVAASGDRFVAVGIDEIETSSDGQTWSAIPLP
jgi:hypothetical protein